MTKRNYDHDCDRCVFLGDVEIKGVVSDLYYHEQVETVIARYSSAPENYNSSFELARTGLVPELSVAMIRAMERGLVKV